MKVLVANLGSSSYKYRLFELVGCAPVGVASGKFERVEACFLFATVSLMLLSLR